ncbi:MAG TPA: hypothetical protein VGO47_00495 [Chlamydiales bacterium]|nr:hypothetical protein [Chlamydiales bacterium]
MINAGSPFQAWKKGGLFGSEASCQSTADLVEHLDDFFFLHENRLVAQLIDPKVVDPDEAEEALLLSLSHPHYTSLTWLDLWALAPWMMDKIVKCIDGPGLGLD